MRLNRGQEFVIGGYTFGGKSFDALIFRYYERIKDCSMLPGRAWIHSVFPSSIR